MRRTGTVFLPGQMHEQAFVERLANPAAFVDTSPERALKVLVYSRRRSSSLSRQAACVPDCRYSGRAGKCRCGT